MFVHLACKTLALEFIRACLSNQKEVKKYHILINTLLPHISADVRPPENL